MLFINNSRPRTTGIGRPIARYLERLASHDLALRSLSGLRKRFYERIEPLAPEIDLSTLAAGTPGTPNADIKATLAWDVSTGSTANVVAVIVIALTFLPILAAYYFTREGAAIAGQGK